MPFVVQWWHDLRFRGRSKERCDGLGLLSRLCNVETDIVLSIDAA